MVTIKYVMTKYIEQPIEVQQILTVMWNGLINARSMLLLTLQTESGNIQKIANMAASIVRLSEHCLCYHSVIGYNEINDKILRDNLLDYKEMLSQFNALIKQTEHKN